jgi:hypothetical protein
MLWTPLTFHDPITPYVPVPWSLGTPLLALTQMPVPDFQAPLARWEQYELAVPAFSRGLTPHSPTHPNTPFSAPPSPCSSALVLGVNTASTASICHSSAGSSSGGTTASIVLSAKRCLFPRARVVQQRRWRRRRQALAPCLLIVVTVLDAVASSRALSVSISFLYATVPSTVFPPAVWCQLKPETSDTADTAIVLNILFWFQHNWYAKVHANTI